MTAKLREKRTSIAAVRAKLVQFDTFLTPLLSHCRLPLKNIWKQRDYLIKLRWVSSLFTNIKFYNLLPTSLQPYVSIETRSLKASQLNDIIRFKFNITQSILSIFFTNRIMHPTTSSLFCGLDKLADFTFFYTGRFSGSFCKKIHSSILLQGLL